MKKLAIFCLVAMVILLFVGCSDDSNQQTEAKFSLDFIEGGYQYYYDDEYLMLFFEFTNNSGETSAPWDLVNVEAFQNGIALTPITFNGQRIDDGIAIDVSIQNGVTTTVVWMFRPDDHSEVSVETSDGQKFTIN